ncbi:MAG: TIGR03619 family F420-dependent LLM class oxidoreductase [Betaproteobacteria bacterium]|nr:TIGR03619 family F420-dependent LLM class oxidoreductase [Betaproteobacteria bacterium]
MRFTLMLGLGGYQDYLAIAKAAEECGWDAISLPDSIFFPKISESEYPYADTSAVRQYLSVAPVIEPFVALSAIAAVTSRLRLVPGVLKVPVRQPLILAKAITSLAVISNNRLVLGAGLSPWKEDFAYNGVDYDKRGKLFDECIAIVRGAMRGDYFEYHSDNYDFGPMKMCPVPDRPVPFIIGGHARPALARAARLGDGWMSANTDFADLKKLIDELNALRAEHGTQHRADFQIFGNDMNARNVDDYHRVADLGVTDLCAAPWNVYDSACKLQEKLDGLRRFADTVIAKLA